MRRDYYDVLGVGRDADSSTVKKAFRRLARELHPDVSEAPDADERFKEVVEAYEVLSSSERRELYDRYGFEGLRSGGFVPTAFDLGSLSDLFSAFFGDDLFATAGRGRRGADVGAELTIDLAEAAQGVTRSVAFQVATSCETCHGSGLEPGTAPVSCPQCGGRGRLQHVSRTAFGEFVRTQTCHACGGMGSVIETPCPACEGAGRTIAERAVDVTIPAGIHDGQRIRISGKGHAGTPGERRGRRLRARSRAAGSALRSRGQRPLLGGGRHAHAGGARGDREACPPSTASRSWSSSPGRNRARSASCVGRACRCSPAPAAVTTGCS